MRNNAGFGYSLLPGEYFGLRLWPKQRNEGMTQCCNEILVEHKPFEGTRDRHDPAGRYMAQWLLLLFCFVDKSGQISCFTCFVLSLS